MLRELVVEGLGVIERAELELRGGCSALTGETGAGKTLIVAALGLLVGGRSDRALVREGAAEALVEGRFVVPPGHAALEVLSAHGIIEAGMAESEAEVVLTRSITADGKGGRARINGRLVTVAALGAVGEQLVEIAGQNEAQGVAAPSRQRALLDAFAGSTALAAELTGTVRAASRVHGEMDTLLSNERQRERELDLLRYEISEIEKSELQEGEFDRLTKDADRLEHAESIALALGRAIDALNGERGAAETIDSAHRDVSAASQRDPALEEVTRRLEAASLEIADIASDLTRSMVAPDPQTLEETRARLDVIARMTRKYGEDRVPQDSEPRGPEAGVLGYLERARARIDELENAESSLGALRAEHESLMARAGHLARELGTLRKVAAPRLEKAMEETLGELALSGARFEVALTQRELFEGGMESVEFRVAANPGEMARPVAKVASGGELSRIALALHLLTSREGETEGSARTMIFDEVDAGVAGLAAQSVGRALADLARATGAQVLLVTHLPQVAAFADYHYRVLKESADARSIALVARVEGAERVDELSRMLAGMPESQRAREHAKELLETASAR
ncbi:MAG: DNA repair protein RecN [Actinobacteria bacterium]|nr:DNA repair protein RecN [Actinomycetota bacterium]